MKRIYFFGKSDKSTSYYFKKLIVASNRPTTIGAICGEILLKIKKFQKE